MKILCSTSKWKFHCRCFFLSRLILYYPLSYHDLRMGSDEGEMPPPPPPKKQKTVSSKATDARAEKEVVNPSAPPKKSVPTPNVLQMLQKGTAAKAPMATMTPSSSEEHVSDSRSFPFTYFAEGLLPVDSPRADTRSFGIECRLKTSDI